MLKRREGTIPFPDTWSDAAGMLVESYQGYSDLPVMQQSQMQTGLGSRLDEFQSAGIEMMDFDVARPVIQRAEDFLDRKFGEWDLDYLGRVQPMALAFESGRRGGFAYPHGRLFGMSCESRDMAEQLLQQDPAQPAIVVHELVHVDEGIHVQEHPWRNEFQTDRRGLTQIRFDDTYDFRVFHEMPSCLADTTYVLDDPRNYAQLVTSILPINTAYFPEMVREELRDVAAQIDPVTKNLQTDDLFMYPSAVLHVTLQGGHFATIYDQMRGSFWMIAEALYDQDPFNSFTRDVMRAHVTADRKELFQRFDSRLGSTPLNFLRDVDFDDKSEMVLLNMFARVLGHSDPEPLWQRLTRVKELMIEHPVRNFNEPGMTI